MTPAQEQALLNAAVQGNFPTNPQPGQTIIQPYPGCNSGGGNVAPSPVSAPIDASNFVTTGCGVTPFYVKTTNTSDGAYTLTMGGNMRDGDESIATTIYGLSLATGGLLWSKDQDNTVGATAANLNPTVYGDWLARLYNGQNFIYGEIEVRSFTSGGGTVLAEDLGDITKFNVNAASEFARTLDPVEQDFCDPCFKDDGTRARYADKIPVGGTFGYAIDIPAGSNLKFRQCVFMYERNKNLSVCNGSTATA